MNEVRFLWSFVLWTYINVERIELYENIIRIRRRTKYEWEDIRIFNILCGKFSWKVLRVDTDILDNYIIPCYEALHSQSKAYIVDDLIQIMKVKGVL